MCLCQSSKKDFTSNPLVVISFAKLDSIITTNKYTAVYYWPNWCTSCKRKISILCDLFKDSSNVFFVSINDPSSKPIVSQKLVSNSGQHASFYKIERHGREKLIEINDRSQIRYFKKHYEKDTYKNTTKSLDALYIFDNKLNILYREYELYDTTNLKRGQVK